MKLHDWPQADAGQGGMAGGPSGGGGDGGEGGLVGDGLAIQHPVPSQPIFADPAQVKLERDMKSWPHVQLPHMCVQAAAEASASPASSRLVVEVVAESPSSSSPSSPSNMLRIFSPSSSNKSVRVSPPSDVCSAGCRGGGRSASITCGGGGRGLNRVSLIGPGRDMRNVTEVLEASRS